MKLNTKINIPIIIFIVVIMIIYSIIIINDSYKKPIRDKMEEFLLSTTRDMGKNLTFYIDFLIKQTILLGNSKHIMDLVEKRNYNDLNKHLEKFVISNQYIKKLSVANEKGIIVSSSDNFSIGDSVADKTYIKSFLLDKNTNYTIEMSESYHDNNALLLPVVALLKRDDSDIIGYFISMVDIHNYLDFLSFDKIFLSGTGNITIFKDDGIIIIHPDTQYILSNIQSLYTYFNDFETNIEKKSYGFFEHRDIKDKKNRQQISAYTKIKSTPWYIMYSIDKDTVFFNDTNNILRLTLISLVIAIVALIAFIYILLNIVIIRRLDNIFFILSSKIIKGDLRSKFPVTSDDRIGKISEQLNYLVNDFKNVITLFSENIGNMETSGILLSDITYNTNTEVSSIDKKIEVTKDNIKEQTEITNLVVKIINEIQNDMAEFYKLLGIQSGNIVSGAKMIEGMIAEIHKMTDYIENEYSNSFDILRTMTKSGEEVIYNIIELINNIADKSGNLINTNNLIKNITTQTNVLSMNASIEAAHAEDFGLGFSIIADEIRNLSDDVKKQSKLIDKWLTEIKKQIKDAVSFSEKTKDVFNSIMNTVESVDFISKIIRTNMKEQSIETENILQMLDNIKNINIEVFNKADNITKNNVLISQSITKLNDLTTSINNSIINIKDKSNFIFNSSNEISNLSEKNKNNILNISEFIDKFKI